MNYQQNQMDILKKAIEYGLLDLSTTCSMVEMAERTKYLEKHQYDIWQGKNGFWYTYLSIDNGRKLVKKNSKEKIENTVIDFYKNNQIATVETMFREWADKKLASFDIQKQSYDRYNATFARYFSDIKDRDISLIDDDELELFVKGTIHDKELSAKQWSDMRTVLKGLYHYARRHKNTNIAIDEFLRDIDISPKAFRRKRKIDEEQVFTDNEVDKIFAYIGAKERPYLTDMGIIFSFQTGLRVGELISLKYSDIDYEKKRLYVSRTEVHYKDESNHTVYSIRESTKGYEGYREVVLTDSAIHTLKQIRRLNPFSEFVFKKQGEEKHAMSFTNRLYRICDTIQIPKRSLHKCRKTYATRLINANVNEKLVAKQLGHTKFLTSNTYYNFSNFEADTQTEIIEKAIGQY